MPENIRAHIKNNVCFTKDYYLLVLDAFLFIQCFNALGTETAKPSQAAQCVGYIGCAELPRNQWQDLISK